MLNNVFIMGNLTKDPELQYLPDGTAICKFQVAINHKYKSPKGEVKEEVDYIPVEVFGKIGEASGEYLSKGSKVLVTGKLKQHRWEKDGKMQSRIGVNAFSVQFLDGKKAKTESQPAAAAAESDEDIPF